MAKIIYGVSGQGFGHSTRSKEILTYLVKQGHQVLVFTYGQGLFFLQKDFDIYEIPGLGLHYKNNKLIYWRTVYDNVAKIINQSIKWHKIAKKFKEFTPDIVVTDFEPLTAVLAKINHLPLISIDNQHQLTNSKVDCPLKARHDLLADKIAIKSVVWGAKYYLVTTFYQTVVANKKTFLFSPIVRQEVLDLKPRKKDYILVYQTSNFDSLVKELKKIDAKFVMFGMKTEKRDGNIEFKNFDTDSWLNYLADCKAIIGNAGLSLISECLYLQKPYLALPIKQQVEQIINAHYLEKLGYGKSANEFTVRVFDNFMKNLSSYEHNLSRYKNKDNQKIFDKINEIIAELV